MEVRQTSDGDNPMGLPSLEFEFVSDQNSRDHRPTAMANVKFPVMKSDKHQNICLRLYYFSDHEC